MKSVIALVLAAGLLLSTVASGGPPATVASTRLVESSTEVGGPIDADTTWTLAGSPYIVTSSILVSVGVTLTIEAGVTVRFESGKGLVAEGTLIARGTAEQPITFTSNQASPAAGDWGGITFASTSPSATYDGDAYTGGSILQYAIVEYGGYGSRKGAVSVEGSAPYIDHNTVRYNARSGIYADTTGTRITNNTVHDNSAYGYGSGIHASRSTVSGNTVYSNLASWNAGGIYAEYSTVSGNTVYNNSGSFGGGIDAYDSTVSGNTISGNSAYYGGGGIWANGNSTVSDNTIYNNSTTSGGGIYALGGTVSGNTVYNNWASQEGGGIHASGGTVSGNTISSNLAYTGGGIYTYSSTVSGNTILGNSAFGYYGDGYGGGIYAFNATSISCNTVVNNSSSAQVAGGLQIWDPLRVISNTLYANRPYDLVNGNSYSFPPLDATNNYWGTTDSVEIAAHIYDLFDDSSRQRVEYSPFLSAPDPCAPAAPVVHRVYLPAIANSYAGGW